MIIIYSKDTGRVCQFTSATKKEAEQLLLDGEAFIEVSDATETVDGWVSKGKFKAVPKQPSQFHEWDWQSKEWKSDSAKAWEHVRNTRSTRLDRCDWTQMPDVALTAEKKAEWAVYRQELRDITLQLDPLNIVWPIAP